MLIAKGDFLEPIFELTFRIFLPRYGATSVWDEVSWSWIIAMALAFLIYGTIAKHIREVKIAEGEAHAKIIQRRFRCSRYAFWALVFFSLAMFRFGSYF